MLERRHPVRRREVELWIARVRLGAVAFAVLEVGFLAPGYPGGYRLAAWITTAVFAVGAVALAFATRRATGRQLLVTGAVALVFDTLVISTYAIVYSYEYGSPTRWALILAVVECALRYGLLGGALLPVALIPFFVLTEWWRAREFGPPGFHIDRVSFPIGIHFLTGIIVGWLVSRLDLEAGRAEARAEEAEQLRDELGHRVDVLEAANRCARALGSSLELEQAFGAFVRELRGLVPFERTALVLIEGDEGRVIATAGRAAEDVYPPGSSAPVTGSVLAQVQSGQTLYRRDMAAEGSYPEEFRLAELGLRSRLVAPLQLGARSIGMVSVVRAEPDAFSPEEVELVSLLGRLVATAVQNIRSYEAERQTVEELRRLSALRADFVSLVSHELRSPMAAVIGSARTLQQRWRQLSAEQREAFLALIADETTRLATLVGDVLDTSRIEAGTFSFTFTDVDMATLVHESVAAAGIGQEEVRVEARLNGSLPSVRGDRERLRQVLQNLIDNAVKYSAAGGEVQVSARADSARLLIEVTDSGPGIPREQQRIIFEKFGRGDTREGSKPGTGLGLFIARSIAEAHGGTVEVRSAPGRGATFTLTLPL
jgi:signal transduction histidine kinase